MESLRCCNKGLDFILWVIILQVIEQRKDMFVDVPKRDILGKIYRTDGEERDWGFGDQLGDYYRHLWERTQESKWDRGSQDGEGSPAI